MALITRRDFVKQTAFAATLYGCPTDSLAETRRIFGTRGQNAAMVDSAAIRKLASQITGHVITTDAPDYRGARLIFNRAFDLHPALIVHCCG